MRPPSANHALNSDRPSNPFSPTAAPDWVLKPQTREQTQPANPPLPSRNTSFQTAPTSLSQEISNTSTGNDTATMPFHGGADIGRSVSAALTISRKPAPPVPQKPSTLSGNVDNPPPPPPPRRQGGAGRTSSIPPALPGTRPVNTGNLLDDDDHPAAVKKTPKGTAGNARANPLALMDDDDPHSDGGSFLSGWAPLKPS